MTPNMNRQHMKYLHKTIFASRKYLRKYVQLNNEKLCTLSCPIVMDILDAVYLLKMAINRLRARFGEKLFCIA